MIITLQYCGDFCHTSTWIGHRHTCDPSSWTPCHHLPPYPLPSPALVALLHAWNLHWSFILHMVMYMFQCYPLKSSHPLLFPLNLEVCSLHLCLLCCPVWILILACDPSSLAFHMIHSTYTLNKPSDNIQPLRTPFPILNQSIVSCPVLTVASWAVYRFLRRQVKWSGIPISWRIFHSLLWSIQSKALAYSMKQK